MMFCQCINQCAKKGACSLRGKNGKRSSSRTSVGHQSEQPEIGRSSRKFVGTVGNQSETSRKSVGTVRNQSDICRISRKSETSRKSVGNQSEQEHLSEQSEISRRPVGNQSEQSEISRTFVGSVGNRKPVGNQSEHSEIIRRLVGNQSETSRKSVGDQSGTSRGQSGGSSRGPVGDQSKTRRGPVGTRPPSGIRRGPVGDQSGTSRGPVGDQRRARRVWIKEFDNSDKIIAFTGFASEIMKTNDQSGISRGPCAQSKIMVPKTGKSGSQSGNPGLFWHEQWSPTDPRLIVRFFYLFFIFPFVFIISDANPVKAMILSELSNSFIQTRRARRWSPTGPRLVPDWSPTDFRLVSD